MAKIIRRSEDFSLDLPRFAIESSDFLKLLEKLNVPEGKLSVTTGESNDETRTCLDGKEDIRSNISLLKSPFKIEIGGLNISVTHYRQKVSFKEDQRAKAMALVAELREYIPWYIRPFVSMPTVISKNLFLLAILPEVWRKFFRPEASVSASLTLSVIFLLIILAIPQFWFYKARVFYRPRESFIQRNKDKIIWSVFAAMFTFLVSQYGPRIEEYIFGVSLIPVNQTTRVRTC